MLIAQAERQFELWTGQRPPAGLFRPRRGIGERRRPPPRQRTASVKQTTFEEFVELARRGTFVPVVKEIIADLLTPVSAFLKIAEHSDYAFLFESVEGGERVARYSFLGKDPFLVLRQRGGSTIIDRSGVTTESDEPFVAALRRLMAEFQSPFVPGLPRFTGGAVGSSATTRRRCSSRRLLDAWAKASWSRRHGDRETEDEAGFMLFDTVLAFDHVKHRILIIANARVTADEDLQALYQFACAKIQFLERELERGLSQPEPAAQDAPDFRSNMTRETYEAGVRTIKEHIAAGDIYQAVLSQRFEADVNADPFTVYRALRHVNPSPYMYFIRMGGLAIVGSSPEMLVRSKAGTSRRIRLPAPGRAAATRTKICASAEELKRNEKERAEHVMLVDLGRNDLGRVCEFGSRQGAAIHGARALLACDAPGLDGRRPAGGGSRSPRCARRLFPGRDGLRCAEDSRDADPRRARADAARPLCRRGRLHRFRRQSRLLHRDPHHHHSQRTRAGAGWRRHRRRLESGG